MFQAGGKRYRLVKIGLVRAACPRQLETTPENLNPVKSIVVTANTEKLGAVQGIGYVPPGVITAGAARRKRLMELGQVFAYAFVDTRITEMRCDDEISSRELMDKLDVAIRQKILGNLSEMTVPGAQVPYIVEVYPFENYFIYSWNGDRYRQAYILDPVARQLKLMPVSQKVEEKFVNAAVERMPRVQTGIVYQPQATANNQTSFRGAPNSELVTGVIRNWTNVLEAVQMYLSQIRNGQHKPPVAVPAFAPVPLVGGKIGKALAAKGIDVYDFARWSAAQQSQEPKTKDGLPPSAYAYVGDKDDPSTWHLKVHDAAHVRNALARVNQTMGIPVDHRAGVMTHLMKLAKKHGVEAQPTAGQTKWAKKRARAA